MASQAISTSDLTNQVTPTGKAVLQFLHNRHNGAKLEDIVKHVRESNRDVPLDVIHRNVALSLDAGRTWGFLETKGSRFVDPNVEIRRGERTEPSDGCRVARRACCRHRRGRRPRRRCCCRRRRRSRRRRRRRY